MQQAIVTGRSDPRRAPLRAAQYVRMSTDHQKYSIPNQSEANEIYAALHEMVIVRTYADAGKSGLTVDRRKALQNLITDVQSGVADFEVILVYDVSRWGRYQNTDEAGYYEFLCRKAGIAVHYCAEQFENDDTPLSALIKSFKRAMAAEYSRELSVKTFAGQSRSAGSGYRVGGAAGYGLRRMVVGANGESKGLLAVGQLKNIFSDRIILVPGPASRRSIARLDRTARQTLALQRSLHQKPHYRELPDTLSRRGLRLDDHAPCSTVNLG
jgi:DNA invertase Pin-like site-specific DNA recombinase